MPEPIIYGPCEKESVKLKIIVACGIWIAPVLGINPIHVNARYVESTQDPAKTSLHIAITELFKEGLDGQERNPEVCNELMDAMEKGCNMFIAEGHFHNRPKSVTIVPNMVDYKKSKGEYRNWKVSV